MYNTGSQHYAGLVCAVMCEGLEALHGAVLRVWAHGRLKAAGVERGLLFESVDLVV